VWICDRHITEQAPDPKSLPWPVAIKDIDKTLIKPTKIAHPHRKHTDPASCSLAVRGYTYTHRIDPAVAITLSSNVMTHSDARDRTRMCGVGFSVGERERGDGCVLFWSEVIAEGSQMRQRLSLRWLSNCRSATPRPRRRRRYSSPRPTHRYTELRPNGGRYIHWSCMSLARSPSPSPLPSSNAPYTICFSARNAL